MTNGVRYEFDEQMQTEIVACLMHDEEFCRRTEGLIQPTYFENEIERVIVVLQQRFWAKYKEPPSDSAWMAQLKFALSKKLIRDEQKIAALQHFSHLQKLTVRSRPWLMDSVAEFAKQQAITNALVECAEIMGRGEDDRFERISKIQAEANAIGLASISEDYNYFERIDERTDERLAIASGKRPKTGVTTGIEELDELLMHKGWGLKELSILMGGAKSGKSFALNQFGGEAILAGKNVLHVTLENSTDVVAMRYDAFFSRVGMREQFNQPHKMAGEVRNIAKSSSTGSLFIREFPSGMFSPSDLRRLVEEYKTKGIKFDLIVIDYMDIMRSDLTTKNPIEDSKRLWIAVRAIGQEHNLALLSATQTTRSGNTSAVAKATDVAEDFNKIRTADLVISINRNDDERAEKKARFFMAAGRNQEDGVTVFVTQDLDKCRSIVEVEDVQ